MTIRNCKRISLQAFQVFPVGGLSCGSFPVVGGRRALLTLKKRKETGHISAATFEGDDFNIVQNNIGLIWEDMQKFHNLDTVNRKYQKFLFE